jgi:cysteinyl-tRNA synthetase
MSSKYLGEQFDIHTGGEDHISVHHTNEIAQSECAFEKKPWVKYWMHGAFLTFKGEKMSKSSGKIARLSELENQGFKPLDYRYFILTGHYRKQLNFTEENLRNAKNSYERLKNIIKNIPDKGKTNEKYLKRFENAINDDLDIPKALQVLWELLRDEKTEGKYRTIEKMDGVLGLKLLETEKIQIPHEVKKLLEERDKARKLANWVKADELRIKIMELGFEILDKKEGWEIKKIE